MSIYKINRTLLEQGPPGPQGPIGPAGADGAGASDATTVSKGSIQLAGAFHSSSTAAVPVINLASASLNGSLPFSKGGTGLTALGTALYVLRVNAAGTALEYAALAAPSDATTGAKGIVQLAGAFHSSSTAALPVVDLTATSYLNGALGAAKGGTGLTAYGTAWQTLGMNAGATALVYTTIGGDVTATGGPGAFVVGKVNATTYPSLAGAGVTGNSPYVSGVSAVTYSALNLAGGAGWVSGSLPVANGGLGLTAAGTIGNMLVSTGSAWQSVAVVGVGDWTNAIGANTVVACSGASGVLPLRADCATVRWVKEIEGCVMCQETVAVNVATNRVTYAGQNAHGSSSTNMRGGHVRISSGAGTSTDHGDLGLAVGGTDMVNFTDAATFESTYGPTEANGVTTRRYAYTSVGTSEVTIATIPIPAGSAVWLDIFVLADEPTTPGGHALSFRLAGRYKRYTGNTVVMSALTPADGTPSDYDVTPTGPAQSSILPKVQVSSTNVVVKMTPWVSGAKVHIYVEAKSIDGLIVSS